MEDTDYTAADNYGLFLSPLRKEDKKEDGVGEELDQTRKLLFYKIREKVRIDFKAT